LLGGDFQHSVAKLRRHFLAIGIFRRVKLRRKLPKERSMRWNLLF